jgi:DNA-directed RNA polymerase specialized sigma24 family protein
LWNLFLVIALNRLRAEEAYHRAAKRDVRLTANEAGRGSLLANLEQPDPAAAFLDVVMAEALEHLPELHCEVVKLRIEGYEVAEIAVKLGSSKRTVERALQEARKQLSVLLPEQS